MATFDANPPAGTRDFLPQAMAQREEVFATVRTTFRRHGFQPMDTPAFERLDTLMGKYGDEGDQLIFKILRRGLEDDADHQELADLALRYDLTVPMARFMARHGGVLGTPFKRYAIAPVWRADRPQKGRFREFVQCDVDTIGSDSMAADADTLLAVTEALDALGLQGWTVHLNSRRVLRGLVAAWGIPAAQEATTLVAIDKLDKVGVDGVAGELRERGIAADAVDALVADLGDGEPLTPVLADAVRERLGGNDLGAAGLAEVDAVLSLVAPNLAASGRIAFSPMLARGLTYYTGPIFEIQHDGLGASIAGGGRYDGLVGMFSGQEVPATGGSLGLERVLLLLDEASDAAAPDVLVTVFDADGRADAMAMATSLRRAGIATDVFVADGRMKRQFKYADRRGVRFAVIRGSEERAAGTVGVKDLASGEQSTVEFADLVSHLQRALA